MPEKGPPAEEEGPQMNRGVNGVPVSDNNLGAYLLFQLLQTPQHTGGPSVAKILRELRQGQPKQD